MTRTVRGFFVFLAFAFFVFHGQLIAAAPPSDYAPIKVVVVSGTNYEMGVQYGEQAADLIAATRDTTNTLLTTQVCYDYPVCQQLVPPATVEKDIQVWTYYLEKYDLKLKDWLLGISQGCKKKGYTVSYRDLVALMVLPQEMWARPAGPYPPETGVTASAATQKSNLLAKGRVDTRPVASCTSFAAAGSATQGGEPMVSLTTGFISNIKLFVILVAFPNEGERFIDLTMAGRVASNTGMNEKFAWIMTASVTAPWTACASSWGLTSEAYFHYLQQYCKSPSDAKAYIDATPKGGVTGNFLFGDKSGVWGYEVGACASAIREPGGLGFIAQTNNYNSPSMTQYNLGAPYFTDTFVRYDTAFQKLSSAPPGSIGLDFSKALFVANDWYDASTGTWHTVPAPNDPNDPNTCNVPGNQCEGGEGQVVQFPAQKMAYLQPGDPRGTSIEYYWPDNPKPTGEYTKWQLRDSADEVARAASQDAMEMIEAASQALEHKGGSLNPQTRNSLRRLLSEASQEWWKGKAAEELAERYAHNKGTQMGLWGDACTGYAIAQLYAQMVSTKLK